MFDYQWGRVSVWELSEVSQTLTRYQSCRDEKEYRKPGNYCVSK